MKHLKNTLCILTIFLSTQAYATIYEDAEDQGTNRWKIYDNSPKNAKISHVNKHDRKHHAIKFEGAGTKNGYILGNWENKDGAWNNTTEKTITWEMNFHKKFTVYVRIMTKKGPRYIYYTNSKRSGGKGNGIYIHIGLGKDKSNGRWQTITRNLKEDLQKYEPNNSLIAVNAFLIRGNGMIDNIALIHTGYTHEIIVRTITNLKNTKEINYLVQQCKINHIGAISVAFKQDEDDEDDSGVVFYPSKIAPIAEGYQDKDILKVLIEKAHSEGIKVKAWIPQFHDQIAYKKHKTWAMQKYEDGILKPVNGEFFVNPMHKGVQDYELSIIQEIVQNYNIDAVVLDWIRFDNYNMDLSPYTQKNYQNEYGYNPKEIDFSSDNPKRREWNDYRTTKIAHYIKRVQKITSKQHIKLGVYILSPDWEEVGQNPSKFYQSIDSISPMAYYDDWKCGENWVYGLLNDDSSPCGTPIIASTKDKVHGKSIIPTFDTDWSDTVYKNMYRNLHKNYPNITTVSWFNYGKWTEENLRKVAR